MTCTLLLRGGALLAEFFCELADNDRLIFAPSSPWFLDDEGRCSREWLFGSELLLLDLSGPSADGRLLRLFVPSRLWWRLFSWGSSSSDRLLRELGATEVARLSGSGLIATEPTECDRPP
jgi:hypothetical protein